MYDEELPEFGYDEIIPNNISLPQQQELVG